MLDAAPAGLLRVNRGADANWLNDLLIFMSNAILKSRKEIFRIQKPSKFNVPGWNEWGEEFNAQYMEAVSHWNTAGHPRIGPLAELKCLARAAFRHEMKFLKENEGQLCFQSMLSKLQRGDCNDFWKEINGIGWSKIAIFHYCVYCKFVTVILFVAISQSYTKIERIVFELCAKVCE